MSEPRRNGPYPVTSFPHRLRQIIAAIEEDLTAKGIAVRCMISERNIHRVINSLGYRRMYVSREEREAVMRYRAARRQQNQTT